MTYEESLIYIESINGLGAKLGLERMERLLYKLGNPQNNVTVIHVAGTNGKGSTCSMLSNILTESGYCTGTYTSPHLEEYNERYTIGNQKISNEDFGEYMGIIKEKCEEMVREGDSNPTVFEVLTALAFQYFYCKKVDFLVLEVGLGGRFDATNVIDKPLLSVITAIGMDHMDYFGDKLEGIAFEKGGIIKEGCPVVLYSQDDKVVNVIKQISEKKNARLFYAERQDIQVIKQDLEETVFSISNSWIQYSNVRLKLLGNHQINNCATVLLACAALIGKGIKLTKNNILRGIEKTNWNGRMEICGKEPIIILDGAHNTDGIAMLSESLKKYFPDKNITLLLGVLGDKEYQKMIRLFVPVVAKIVITEPDNPRALNVDSLEKMVAEYKKPVYKVKNVGLALETAINMTGKDDVLCCAGSLYLIGEIRTLIGNQNLKQIGSDYDG